MLPHYKTLSNFSLSSDRDAPAADLHDPEVPVDRVRAGRHRRPGLGEGPGLHAGEREEEGRPEERTPATDIQRGEVLRGETEGFFNKNKIDF